MILYGNVLFNYHVVSRNRTFMVTIIHWLLVTLLRSTVLSFFSEYSAAVVILKFYILRIYIWRAFPIERV